MSSANEILSNLIQSNVKTKTDLVNLRASIRRRNTQLDSFMIHLLAVSMNEILEASQEEHVEVTIPFKIEAIYVSTVAGLLASRGFEMYAKTEGSDDWVLATIASIKRDDVVISIAIKTQDSHLSKKDMMARNQVEEHIRKLEEELEIAKDVQSTFKRKNGSVSVLQEEEKNKRHKFHQ